MFIWVVRLLTAIAMIVTFIPDTPLVFLPVNTFLAYLPIELSYQILRNKTKRSSYLLMPIWLLFFPNIPYLLTDFVHVKRLHIYAPAKLAGIPDVRHWTLFIILALLVFTYVLLGFVLAEKIIATFPLFGQTRMLKNGSLMIFSFLSSLGVYVGRFPPRIHSIYLFKEPLRVIQIAFVEWNFEKLLIILLFTIFHLWLFFMFWFIKKVVIETEGIN